MDEKKRAETVDALRNAGSALRPEEPAPNGSSALMSLLVSEAMKRKAYEEQDETSFALHLEGLGHNLLDVVLSHKQLDVGPKATTLGGQSATPALTVFNQILKAATDTRTDHSGLIGPFLHHPSLKNWGDFDPTQDLVVVRYETPAPVEHLVDASALSAAVAQAKVEGGAVDRVVNALRNQGIDWTPFKETGEVSNLLVLRNVEARWMVVINTTDLATDLAEQLSLVTAPASPRQEPWWRAAQASAVVPQCIVELIRGRKEQVFIRRFRAYEVMKWAQALPGWQLGPEPLSIRAVQVGDILSE